MTATVIMRVGSMLMPVPGRWSLGGGGGDEGVASRETRRIKKRMFIISLTHPSSGPLRPNHKNGEIN